MTNKEEILNQLTDCLHREDSLLADLVAAAEAQMAALRDNDLEAIKVAVQRVNNLSVAMTALENERQQIQATLDHELGLTPGSALSDILPHTGGKVREALVALLKEMRKKAGQLGDITEINAIMTRRAMTLNQLLLSVFDPVVKLTYRGNGAVKQGLKARSVLDKTV